MRGLILTLLLFIGGGPGAAMLACGGLGVATPFAAAQTDGAFADLVDRPITEIRLDGLERVDEQLVRNNLRTAVGDPFDPATVRQDVTRLEQLGRFERVTASAELQTDGTVHVIFALIEQPIISEVQVVGNTLVTDQELRQAIQVARGGPRDDYLIESAKRAIEALYRKRGHYLTSVTVDESELERAGVLIFRVIEGPRVRIRAIEFKGNHAFEDDQLHAEVETRTALILIRRGELDEEQLLDDVAALDRFYRDRGYIDVRVDRQIALSPDNTEAKVTFVIDEGEQYIFRHVRVERAEDGGPLTVFSSAQIEALLEIRRGDVYRADTIRQSVEAIRDAYGRLGYYDTQVQVSDPVRAAGRPAVDLVLSIREGIPVRVGLVQIQGNFLTKDKVIRRDVRIQPGRPLDATEIERSSRRLRDTRLFNNVRMTVQQPRGPTRPGYPEMRDILVEVDERNTGAVNFGLAAGSDSGLFGEFSLNQTNFDIADTPSSLGELLRGRAFRGAGQEFNMVFRPGNELFQYAVSLTEPHLLDSQYSLSVGGSFRQRQFNEHDEERISASFQIGRELGDIWGVAVRGRAERVEYTDIADFAPTELFIDAGPDTLTSLGVSLTRTTITTISRPGRGSRLELAYDRIGALGGDFDFNSVTGSYTVFFTLDEDFLGRKSTLRLNSEVGYIFGGGRAPTYERFYRGGRDFRAFRFRTISPKGIRNDNGEPSDEPIGGEWMFFAGGQYEFPLFGEAVTGVLFVDSGTVTADVGFEDYRLSVGGGVRLYIPQFGPVPIAFDFGVPLLKQSEDEEQIFSFSAEVPF